MSKKFDIFFYLLFMTRTRKYVYTYTLYTKDMPVTAAVLCVAGPYTVVRIVYKVRTYV